MIKAEISTIDEEFEKSRVKAHVRTRKGKLERVKEFERKGEVVHPMKPWRGPKTSEELEIAGGERVDMKPIAEKHFDVQELMEGGVDIPSLKNGSTFVEIESFGTKGKYRYKSSYRNPVGVEVLILESF